MAEIIGLSDSYTERRAAFLKQRGDINREEVTRSATNRKKNARRRMNAIRQMEKYNADIDILIVDEQIRYFEAVDKINDKEITISDIDTLSNIIQMDLALINARNIKFIVNNYTRMGKHDQATKFLDQCLAVLDRNDRRLIEAILKAKQEILNYSEKEKLKNTPPKPGDVGDGRE